MPTEISADIEGIIRELEIEDYLYPLYELVVNSFQAIAERFKDDSQEKGKVDVKIVRCNRTQEGIMNPVERIVVSDNGLGFAKENYKSFSTAYSSHKAKLGGKGIGRFAALAVFNELKVESVYEEGGVRMKRIFSLTRASHGKIEEIFHDKCEEEIGTKVELISISDTFRDASAIGDSELIAENVLQHVLLYYLNAKAPKVTLNDNGTSVDLDVVFEAHGNAKPIDEQTMLGYTFAAYAVPKAKKEVHKVMYCAHNRVVLTKRLTTIFPLFDAPVVNESGEEVYFNVYVVSPYLDKIVNLGRTSLKFPRKNQSAESENILLQGKIYEQDIDEFVVNGLHILYADEISKWKEDRRKRIEDFVSADDGLEFRNVKITDNVLNNFGTKADKKEIRGFLTQEKCKMTLAMYEKKDRLKEKDYSNKPEYQDLMREVLGLYQDENMAQLAQYVRHRKVVVELLEQYLGYVDKNAEDYENEKALHNLIYTMGATQSEMSYDKHNLWLLDDRLTFYRYIASDKAIVSHEALKGSQADSQKEPDITLYDVPFIYGEKDDGDEIKSIVIFELKRPNRNVTYWDYLKQADEQINGIRKGLIKGDRGDRIPAQSATPIFFYYICDENAYNSLKDNLIANYHYSETPYNSIATADNMTHKEIMTFKTVLSNAKRRNRIFFMKLGLIG